jgi:hypothetical protein
MSLVPNIRVRTVVRFQFPRVQCGDRCGVHYCLKLLDVIAVAKGIDGNHKVIRHRW